MPKGKWVGPGGTATSGDVRHPHRITDPTRPVRIFGLITWVSPTRPLIRRVAQPRGREMAEGVKEAGKSECRSCNGNG
jgi:hypothetical protein